MEREFQEGLLDCYSCMKCLHMGIYKVSFLGGGLLRIHCPALLV